MDKNFHTFSEYMKKEDNALTASMEDYLEMIYRLTFGVGFTRIHDLSAALNVQPPSATKMVQRLAKLKLLEYEKYGVILIKEEGRKVGEVLLKRHNIIEKFLRILGVSEAGVLMETEKVEHTLSEETVRCLEVYVNFMMENEEVKQKYDEFRVGT